MPNTPAQFPNFDLPGAEWFGLSPNAQIAISGRRRKSVNLTAAMPGGASGAWSVLPNAIYSNFGQVSIETNFLPTSGIYLHYFAMIWSPQDNSGALSIGQASIGFGIGTQTFVYFSLGIPTQTNGAPALTQNILVERDLLLTGRDIAVGAPLQGDLYVQAAISPRNTDSVAHGLAVYAQMVYTRLEGFTE